MADEQAFVAFTQLEEEYCPPLDPALLSAILSDYHLADPEQLSQARATLDQLKDSALLEEAAGFDPSGTGAQDSDDRPDRRAESCPETAESTTTATDLTSLSNGVNSRDLDEHWSIQGGTAESAEDLEALDDATKLQLFQEIFGDGVSKYTVQHTLKKCGGKWQATMDELLNHAYLDGAEDSDDGRKLLAKGVEAFSADNGTRRARKGKAKGRKYKSLDDMRRSASPATSPGPTRNKWTTASDDVEYIASRTRTSTAAITSIYTENGASIPKTIGALLRISMEESKHIVTDDAAVAKHARDMGRQYPTVAPHYLATLIRLTHPSTTAAHELADALTTKPQWPNGGLQIIPHYASPHLSDDDSGGESSRTTRSPATSHAAITDDVSAAARANAYASARATAYSQASAAHRKAKSNPLMGGAAAYYSQTARDYSSLRFSASAAAADQLATSQSSATQLDLHGVDVLNGIRIAQERVEAWWAGLGESRVNGRVGAGERAGGYRIVVGRGTHSEGGKGKLGPAVSKALRQDGWRIENEGAVIVVRGKGRR
ncbi:hypothetical protein LTR62_003466 [Meristemomyces frigidus]|uniref:Smr domain-containing protein n=1 Tax=Meristemomyces frigidus TaxID=1508187 RepID=A0AAN7YPN6_9PEZI|nr:hypothetical protein LTR62_003466 [Meristemomyces frigidus]